MEFLDPSGDPKGQIPDYTNYIETNKYESASILYSPGVLKGLYDMTKSFMDNLLPPNFLSEDLIAWDAQGSPSLTTSYTDLVNQYKGLITFLVFIILICILVPVSGLIFACLRCCGLCGAKARASEKKKDLCIKIILGSLLIVCWGVLLFATISAFATNSDMKGGIDQLPENGEKVYNDSVEYIDGVNDHAHTLLGKNYKEFSDVFKDTLRDSGQQTVDNLPFWSDIKVITNISTFVDNLSNIKTELTDLQQNIGKLKNKKDSLIEGMKNIKTHLLNTIQSCGFLCSSMTQEVQDLDITMNFDIPDVPDIFQDLHIEEIKRAADDANQRVENVPENINKNLKLVLDTVNTEIDQAGNTIGENLKTMDDLVDTVKKQMASVYSSFKDGNDYIEDYYPYFYYVGIVVCCLLLLILVFLFFGLVYGAFGNRPDKYKSYCCSKGSGSVFLMCAVVVIFIITAIICIMTFIMSVSGLAADRVMCYPLRNPDKSSIIKVINDYVEKNIKDSNEFSFNITDILQNCYNNQSIYQVLDVKSTFDIDKTIEQFGINETIDGIITEIVNGINDIFPSFQFMTDETKQSLEQLTNVNINIDFSGLKDALSQNVVSGNLDQLLQTLKDLKAIITDQTVAGNLQKNIDEINVYNTNTLVPFVNEVKNALVEGEKLQNDLKMGSVDFPEAIKTLISQIENVQKNLNEGVIRTDLGEAATQFADLIKDQIAGYTTLISDAVKNKLGQCGPLNVAIHAALIAFCDDIALPWNGFWASLFISMVTFVPILVVSVWLASIYKSYKSEGQLFDRDPKDRGKRNKQAESNVYYNMPPRNPENPLSGMGYNDNNHNYYHASAPNDNRNSRYYDMAPKFNRQQEASTRF